jgi:hypothetical protein
MSSGNLVFRLPGILVDASFIDGKISHGTLNINGIKYQGTYDENCLLHGNDCSMTIDNTSYQGVFEHGELKLGNTLIDGKVVENGEYTFTSTNKKPHLKNGKKIMLGMVWDGVFDNSGYLIEGTCVNGTTTYEGKFSQNKLMDGKATYIISDKIFTCVYSTVYDNDTHSNLFSRCLVDWNGTLEVLSRKLLVMVCCSSLNPTLAHKFFINYLGNFDGSSIRFLHKSMFDKEMLTPESEAGLMIILENLKRYSDYTPNADSARPKLKRSLSAENVPGYESTVDVLNKYRRTDH